MQAPESSTVRKQEILRHQVELAKGSFPPAERLPQLTHLIAFVPETQRGKRIDVR
jgi:hypothetical protein